METATPSRDTASAMSEAWATRWITAWLGAATIASANGAVREASYGKRIEERTAQGLSGISLVGALTLYFWALQSRWPIPSRRGALGIGFAWVAMTVAFEFGLGRGVQKQSWGEMLSAYNLAQGQTWPLVLAWIGLGPEVVRRLQGTPGAAGMSPHSTAVLDDGEPSHSA